MTLSALLEKQGNDLTNHDLAALAEWASNKKHTEAPEWKKAYALIREGADTLLRRRALQTDSAQAIENH